MFNFNSQNKCASNLRKVGSLQDMLSDNSMKSITNLFISLNLKIKKGSIAELKMKEQILLSKYLR